MQRPKLTKRAVDACQPNVGERLLWCGETRGFGVRIYPTGRKIFFVQVRVNGRTRKDTIGPYGAFTVDQARSRAEDVIRGARAGIDPSTAKRNAKSQVTLAELCEAYLEAAEAGLVVTRFKRAKSPSTVAIDRGRVSRHIVPTIGHLMASSVTKADVQRMLDQIAKGKTAGIFKGKQRGKARVTGGLGAGARVVELLGGMYSWASERGMVTISNPAHGLRTAKGQPKDRVLAAEELAALGQSIKAAKFHRPAAAAALELIALTGLRRQEAVRLRWSEVDVAASCLRLQSTKTGKSIRAIGQGALTILASLPRQKSDFVFPAAGGKKPSELKKVIADMFNQAGLKDARAHDLRRTFASMAAELGYSDATIGELLGHAKRGVTAVHYVRRRDDVLVAAANAIQERVSTALEGRDVQNVYPFRARA